MQKLKRYIEWVRLAVTPWQLAALLGVDLLTVSALLIGFWTWFTGLSLLVQIFLVLGCGLVLLALLVSIGARIKDYFLSPPDIELLAVIGPQKGLLLEVRNLGKPAKFTVRLTETLKRWETGINGSVPLPWIDDESGSKKLATGDSASVLVATLSQGPEPPHYRYGKYFTVEEQYTYANEPQFRFFRYFRQAQDKLPSRNVDPLSSDPIAIGSITVISNKKRRPLIKWYRISSRELDLRMSLHESEDAALNTYNPF